jgi:hypothetical protein
VGADQALVYNSIGDRGHDLLGIELGQCREEGDINIPPGPEAIQQETDLNRDDALNDI